MSPFHSVFYRFVDLYLPSYKYYKNGTVPSGLYTSLGLVTIKFALLCYMVWRYRYDSHQPPYSRAILSTIGFMHILDAIMWPTSLAQVVVESISFDSFMTKSFGLIIFLLLILEIPTVTYLARDLKYVKTNLYQGYTYRYFILRSVFHITTSILSYPVMKYRSVSAAYLSQLFNMVSAAVLLFFQYWRLPFINFGYISSLFPIFDALHFWESFLIIVRRLYNSPHPIEIGLFSFVTVPLILLVFRNFLRKRVEALESTPMMKITDGYEAKLYLNLMYLHFLKRNNKSDKLKLHSMVMLHMKNCQVPYCMCFFLKSFDVNFGTAGKVQNGYRNSGVNKIAHMLHSRQNIGESNKENYITIFRDEHTISGLKTKHLKGFVRKLKTVIPGESSPASIDQNLSKALDDKSIEYRLNLNNQTDFCKVMCSFLVILRQRIKGDIFEFFLDKVSFFIFEYQNFVSALVSLYNFMHSPAFERDRSVFKHFILESYVSLAKRQLDMQMDEMNDSLIRKVEFSKIFEYRERIANVRNNIKTGMLKKIDFYMMLRKDEIDVHSVLELGEEVEGIITNVKNELDALSKTCLRNLRLLKETIAFEVCLLEKNFLSAKTRQALKDTNAEMPFYRETIKTKDGSKNKFNFLNSSNVVIFANCLQDSIRITKFTTNACDLFNTTPEQLMGSEIKSYMPSNIAVVHDTIIMSYLNGSRTDTSKAVIQSVLRTFDGNYKSIIVIPKLEYMFSDDIYIGAVIIVRKKNQFPILYTDNSGCIIGSNRQANELMKINKMDPNSLFSMFPRLFPIYFPSVRRESTETISLVHQNGVANKSSDPFECLFFRMLSNVSAQIHELQKFKYKHLTGDEWKISSVRRLWNRLKQYLMYSKQQSLWLLGLNELILHNLDLLIDDLESLLRVSMTVENHKYRLNLEIYELCMPSAHTCSKSIKQFFRFIAISARRDLLKLMQLSPETIKSIYFICEKEIEYRDIIRAKNHHFHDRNTNSKESKNFTPFDTIREEVHEHSSHLQERKREHSEQISPMVSPDIYPPTSSHNLKSLTSEKPDRPYLQLQPVQVKSSLQTLDHIHVNTCSKDYYGEGYEDSTDKLGLGSKYETPTNGERDKDFNLMSLYKGNYMGPRLPIDFSYSFCKPSQIDQAVKIDNLSIDTSKKISKQSKKSSNHNSKQLDKMSPGKRNYIIEDYDSKQALDGLSQQFKDSSKQLVSQPYNFSPSFNPYNSFSTLAAYQNSAGMSKRQEASDQIKQLPSDKQQKNAAQLSPSNGTLMEVETTINYHKLLVSKEIDRTTLGLLIQDFTEYILHQTGDSKRETKQIDLNQGSSPPEPREPAFPPKNKYDLFDDGSLSFQNTDTSNFIMPKQSDAFKTHMDLNQSSTLLRTAKKDRKYIEKINRLRLTIEKKKDTLNYARYLNIIYIIVACLIVFRILINALHDNSAMSTLATMTDLNVLGNSLRPSAFHYKEAVRREIMIKMSPSTKNYFLNSFINWYGHLLVVAVLNKNFEGVSNVMKVARIPWLNENEGRQTQPTGSYSMMIFVANYMSTIVQMKKIPMKDSAILTPAAQKLWGPLKFYARELFFKELEVFENGLDDIQGELDNIRIFLYLGLFLNLGLVIAIGILLLMIDLSIKGQTNSSQELLLRLNAKRIDRALLELSKRVVVREDEVKKDAKEFKSEVMNRIYRVKEERMVEGSEIASPLNKQKEGTEKFDFEKEFLHGGRTGTPHAKPRQLAKGRKEQRASRTLLLRSDKHKSAKIAWVYIGIILAVFVAMPIVNFFYLYSLYSSVKPKVVDMGNIGIIGASFYASHAILFQYILDGNDNVTADKRFAHLFAIQEQSLHIQDDFVRERLSQIQVCPTLVKVLGVAFVKPCSTFTGLEGSFTMQEAIHALQLRLRLFITSTQNLTLAERKERIEQIDFGWQEMLMMFTSITIRLLNEEMAARIQTLVTDKISGAGKMMYVILTILVGVTCCIKFVWINRRLRQWNQMMKLLKILEDQILDNEYVKAYFQFKFFSVFE